VKENAK